jgi:sugar diacid utilization regulator
MIAAMGRTKASTRRASSAVVAATLGEIIDNLGSAVVTLLAAPRGIDVALTEPLILDPLFEAAIEPGDVLLAVGTGAGSPDARDLLSLAGRAQAGALVLRIPDTVPAELVDAATSAGVALMAIGSEVAWGQFYALLRTALAGAGRPPQAEAGVGIGDLFGLANAVAAMAGGAVTIEDPHSRVLAYSSHDEPLDEPRRQTILGRRIPAEWMRRLEDAGFFRQLWSSDGPVRYHDPSYPGFRPRLAIAVRAGGEILGSIWVAEGRTPFGPQTDEALREAAGIAALHLIRARAVEGLERRMRGDLVRSLLEGRGPIDVAASRLGIDARTSTAVIGFEPATPDEAEAAMRRESVLDLVRVWSQAFRRQAACASIASTIYALLPWDESAADGLRALAGDIRERASAALGVTLLTGIGSVVPHLRDVPRSRREADQVIRVLTAGPGDRSLASIEDVRSRAILLELRDLAADRPHMLDGKLRALDAHDAEHATAYAPTLAAFLDAFGDVGSASRRTGVHPNTFRYRLRRLVEISGIDLADPDERVVTELQLRLR